MHLRDPGQERWRSGSGSEDGGIGATTEKRDQESWQRERESGCFNRLGCLVPPGLLPWAVGDEGGGY